MNKAGTEVSCLVIGESVGAAHANGECVQACRSVIASHGGEAVARLTVHFGTSGGSSATPGKAQRSDTVGTAQVKVGTVVVILQHSVGGLL